MPEEASSSQYRILGTEDDADTREVLRLLLELQGFVGYGCIFNVQLDLGSKIDVNRVA
jgi:hypothetical protein